MVVVVVYLSMHFSFKCILFTIKRLVDLFLAEKAINVSHPQGFLIIIRNIIFIVFHACINQFLLRFSYLERHSFVKLNTRLSSMEWAIVYISIYLPQQQLGNLLTTHSLFCSVQILHEKITAKLEISRPHGTTRSIGVTQTCLQLHEYTV